MTTETVSRSSGSVSVPNVPLVLEDGRWSLLDALTLLQQYRGHAKKINILLITHQRFNC